MMNKRILFLVAAGLAILAVGLAVLLLRTEGSRKLTFGQCEAAGGEVWRVDYYDPEICPACAEYAACAQTNEGAAKIGELCPQTAACAACMQDNFPYPDRCPGGRTKIGEISDAATWFQCCR
jgi:hypothetical protein